MEIAKLTTLFGWVSPMDKGAVGNGSANDYAAVAATITAAGVDGTIYLPSGKNFRCESDLNWLSGQKVIGPGAILSAPTTVEGRLPDGATAVEFHGVKFVGWKRAITQTSPTHTVSAFVSDGCKYTGQREAGISLIGLASGCRVTDNDFANIGVTGAVNMVTACYIGADDATGVYTGQGKHTVTGNKFTNIINPDASALEVHALLVRGHGCIVDNNEAHTVSSGIATSCEGFYIDCLNSSITNNVLTDAGDTDFMTIKGDLATGGGNRITNNTLKWITKTGVRGIGVFAPRTTVKDNSFMAPDSGDAGVVFVNSDDHPHCAVEDNNFYGGNSSIYILLRSGNVSCRRNKVYQPALTTAVGGAIIGYQAGASAASDIHIEDNEVFLSAAWTSTTSYHVCFRVLTATRNITGLRVRNNKAWNVSAASGTWRVVEVSGSTGTHSDWDISGNETNVAWRGVDQYTTVFGNTPARLTRSGKLSAVPISLTTATTLTADESGGVFDNLGATATRVQTLPAATPGLEFTFNRVTNQVITITPDGSETINGVNSSLHLTSIGQYVALECAAAGAWSTKHANLSPERLTQAQAASAIADTGRTFIDGQKMEYTDPDSGAVVGIICTTPGAGGTAVFRDYAVISAS